VVGLGVAFKLRTPAYGLDQDMLLPVSMREWLPADHVAYFIVDTLSGMDLSSFEAGKRIDGWGGASYPASSMVAVLMYGYMQGVLSSRQIERKCWEDVGFRVVAQGVFPDHTTICRFRANHEHGFRTVFTQVLQLCHRAGLVDLRFVAVDGTKIKANASIEQSFTAEELAGMLTKLAGDIDAEEDDFERRCPKPAPVDPGLAAPGRDRVSRIKQGLADLEREAAGKTAAGKRAPEARPCETRPADSQPGEGVGTGEEEPVCGDPPAGPPQTGGSGPGKTGVGKTRSKANVTDPESRIMRTKKEFIQGYNAQVAAVASQVVVAVEVFQNPADTTLLKTTVGQARMNLTAATGDDPGHLTVVADAGYYSTANTTIEGTTTWIPAGSQFKQQRNIDVNAVVQDRKYQAATRYNQGLVTARQAALEADVSRNHLYQIASRLRRQPTGEPSPLQAMAARMATVEGKALYKQRSSTIEPVFAQIKHNRGIRQLTRRGLRAANQEFLLIVTAGNLLKAFKAR